MKKTARKVFVLLLPVVMLLCACGRADLKEQKTAKDEPRKVTLVKADKGVLPRTVMVTGTLAADEEVTAALKVSGRVGEIAVDLGSPAAKGQSMLKLDPVDFRLRVNQAEAALRQARARLGLPPEGTSEIIDPEKTASVLEARAVLNEAKQNRDRAAQLFEKNLISKSDLDAAVSKLLVAESRCQAAIEDVRDRQALLSQRKSELELARQQLADTVLYSPISGSVKERKVSVGEFLAAGAPAVILVKTDPLRLKASVPERDAAGIKTGMKVIAKLEGDEREHAGAVARVSPVIDKQSRTLAVEAEFGNRGGGMRPGSFARAEILLGAGEPSVLIPSSSIVTFAGIEKVLVVKDGKTAERRIRTGRRSGDLVEVIDGLSAGDLFIAEPGTLTGGKPVSVDK